MEAEDLLLKDRVHHGHNIRRIRLKQGLKQDAMADLVNLSQQTVSRYEKTRDIDEEMLERFAKALKVPIELLEASEEEALSITFENITNNNSDHAISNSNTLGRDGNYGDNHNIYNPIEKITELYERLLKEEKEKYNTLEQRLADLEQQIKGQK